MSPAHQAPPVRPVSPAQQPPSVRPVSPAHQAQHAPSVRPVSPAHQAQHAPSVRPVSPAHQAPSVRPTSPASPTDLTDATATLPPVPPNDAEADAAGAGPRTPDRRGGGPTSPAVTSFRGARSELRRQLKEQKRVRIVALFLATLLVLGALPLYFGIRAATRDPVFNTLDSLAVPDWARVTVIDEVSGSRWCIYECRFRERQAESQRDPAETARVYEQALADSGWQRWAVSPCPDQPVEGHYTCWRRDEYTLDLWIRQPSCADDPLRNRPTVEPAPGTQAEAVEPPGGECSGSAVSFKVRNAIDDPRTRPGATQDPGQTGEDPDPVFSDAPLPTLTQTP
jgi:integrin beta 3